MTGNKKKITLLFGTVLSLRLASVSLGADAPLARVLTWEECVRLAAQSNPRLYSAQAGVDSARANRAGAVAPFLPQVSAEATHTRTDSDATPGGAAEVYSAGVSGRQNLFAGGDSVGRYKQADANLDLARSAWDRVHAEVFFDLRSAFARTLFAQEQLALTRAIAERRAQNVRLVQLRFEAGREHKGSYLRSHASYSQSAFDVSQSSRAFRVAQRELLKAMGRSQFEVVVVTGTLHADVPTETPAYETILEDVPSYREALYRTRSIEAGVIVSRAGLLPTLDAVGSKYRTGGDWPPENDRWTTGLNLSYAFFPGGANFFDYRSAKADRRQAQYDLEDTREATLVDLETAYANYVDAAEREQVQAEFKSAAEVRAEIARSQYTSGLLTFDDWDLIENDLISSQKNHLTAQRDAMIAAAAWDKVQGKGDLP